VEPVIGIDFGTTNSEVAMFSGTTGRVLADSEGARVIPSAVYLDEGGGCYVGQAARNVAALHPQRTILFVKRELGSDKRYYIDGQQYGPEEIASFIFSHLKEMAEQQLKCKVTKAVVTVPANFDDTRRQATKRAAAAAGLQVVRLLNEPTAAALAYGIKGQESRTILVFDLGGGTFDVSILQAGDGVFQVLATRGDNHLGGVDFDLRIAELLFHRFHEETGIDLKRDRLAVQKVLQEAERAKIELSSRHEVEIDIPFIAANLQGPCHLSSKLTREEFEELISAFVDRTLRLTRGALQDAGLRSQDVERILMVGGSTRIPAVHYAVEKLFGRPVATDISPEEVVACGAAIQAGILCREARRMVLVDVTPLGLGVETAGKKMTTLVRRNTILPTSAKAVFTTVEDFQRTACIKVLQGERYHSEDNIELGFFLLENLHSDKRGEPNIEVRFDIDIEGIVHVYARDLQSGCRGDIELYGSVRPGEEELQRLVIESRAAELEDLFTSS
jgi:molecular chaperone DnaK